jgi:hypothetical protein
MSAVDGIDTGAEGFACPGQQDGGNIGLRLRPCDCVQQLFGRLLTNGIEFFQPADCKLDPALPLV